MTDQEILDMANEAGFVLMASWHRETLLRMARMVQAREREDCAKLVETLMDWPEEANPYDCALAIRSRRR